MYDEKYLRAESYEDFLSECVAAGLTVDGEMITSSHDYSLILIGALYKNTGVMLEDEEGNQFPEKVALPGYHANLRAKKTIGIEHLAIAPDNVLVQWPLALSQ